MYEQLEFGQVKREPDIRRAKDMADVIIDKDWLQENEDAELYYMFRDLWRKGDKEKIRENDLRYDITVIPNRKMGKEYVKTKGHYHPLTSEGITYPEIYEVLEGKAHYLLQKGSEKGIDDVVLVEAEAGEKAVIPPGYGHITINPADETLKMANWLDRTFDSVYRDISEMEGGAYYELTNGKLVKNENYEDVPELRKVEPVEVPQLGIKTGKDMYQLIENPENLRFLSEPEEYVSVFENIF